MLREVCARARVETKRANAGLPISAVFSSIITLPRMAKKEIPAAVQWEAKKLVPLPIEEMVIDWKLLDEPDASAATSGAKDPARESKTTRVLLTGAPRALVNQYLAVCKAAGLELVSPETEAFALIRSLVGGDPSVILILDIGCMRTSMVIVEDATPVLSRSVDIGGRHFTRGIAERTNVDLVRAENMKLDLAVAQIGNPAAAPLSEIIASTLSPVIQEVRYSLNLYQSQEAHRGRVVEKVILAGGSALLPSLPEMIARELNLRVFVGDPWARVIYPVDLRPALDTIGPRCAVAIGLAMREIL
jgi:type IV pilus assembly protein PilM